MTSNTIYHYVYRITNLVEKKYYYGKRSSKIEPKRDLGIKYFSSSTDKEFISDQKLNPQNYKYKIVQTFDTVKEALTREIKLHFKFDVKKNYRFYNKANQKSDGFSTSDGSIGTIWCHDIDNNNFRIKLDELPENYIVGRYEPLELTLMRIKNLRENVHTKDVIEKSANSRLGRKASSEHKAAITKGLTGKKRTDEQKARMSIAQKIAQNSEETKRKHRLRNNSGAKNPRFLGYYITPNFITEYATKLVEIGISKIWCTKSERKIIKAVYTKMKYLRDIGPWESLKDKTYKDIGFGYITKEEYKNANS